MNTAEQQLSEFMLFKGRRRLPVCLIVLPSVTDLWARLLESLRQLSAYSDDASPLDVTVVLGCSPQPVRLCTRRILTETNESFSEVSPAGYKYSLTSDGFERLYNDFQLPSEVCAIDVLSDYLLDLSALWDGDMVRYLLLGKCTGEEVSTLRHQLGGSNIFFSDELGKLLEELRKTAEVPVNEKSCILRLPESFPLDYEALEPQATASRNVVVNAIAVSNCLYLPIAFQQVESVKLQELRDEQNEKFTQSGFSTVYAENPGWSVIDLDHEIFFGRLFHGVISMDGKDVHFCGYSGTWTPPPATTFETPPKTSFKKGIIASVVLSALALVFVLAWRFHPRVTNTEPEVLVEEPLGTVVEIPSQNQSKTSNVDNPNDLAEKSENRISDGEGQVMDGQSPSSTINDDISKYFL